MAELSPIGSELHLAGEASQEDMCAMLALACIRGACYRPKIIRVWKVVAYQRTIAGLKEEVVLVRKYWPDSLEPGEGGAGI